MAIETPRRLLFLVCFLATAFSLHIARAEPGPGDAEVKQAFERCARISAEIGRIRGLELKEQVKVETQSLSDFEEYVREAYRKQFGEERGQNRMKALVRLGALREIVDLEQMLVTMIKSQAAAYYDPHADTYRLLMTNIPAMLLDPVSSHELCHALQDQHFSLDKYLPEDPGPLFHNSDALAARQCVVEGEAMLVMLLWTVARETGMDDAELIQPSASMAIKMQASMELDQLIGMMEQQAVIYGDGAEEIIAASRELAEMPRYLVEGMMAPYMLGALMIDSVKSQGGWPAVSALYANPPQSTEQVLHPEKLLGGRDIPTPVSLADVDDVLGADWARLDHDVIGELGIRIIIRDWFSDEQRNLAEAKPAAAGWDGDLYAYFENAATGGELLAWKTTWDTPQDAREFAVAVRLVARLRFPDQRLSWRSDKGSDVPYQVWEVEPGRFLKLTRSGRDVGIVDSNDEHAVRNVWN